MIFDMRKKHNKHKYNTMGFVCFITTTETIFDKLRRHFQHSHINISLRIVLFNAEVSKQDDVRKR